MEGLRHFCLSNCRFESDAAVLALAQKDNALETFELWSQKAAGISQSTLAALIRNLGKVKELNLDYCQLSDEVLCAIAAHCPQL
jgi:hypothetical protein